MNVDFLTAHEELRRIMTVLGTHVFCIFLVTMSLVCQSIASKSVSIDGNNGGLLNLVQKYAERHANVLPVTWWFINHGPPVSIRRHTHFSAVPAVNVLLAETSRFALNISDVLLLMETRMSSPFD